MLECRRGEIYLVNWNPGRGSEQTGFRPAVIIQNDTGNTYSPTTIIAACTTTIKKSYPFTVQIKPKESGLDRDCAISLAQIMTIDKARLGKKCGMLPEERMRELDAAIKVSLGLDQL